VHRTGPDDAATASAISTVTPTFRARCQQPVSRPKPLPGAADTRLVTQYFSDWVTSPT
jgi:hypothetical protein